MRPRVDPDRDIKSGARRGQSLGINERRMIDPNFYGVVCRLLTYLVTRPCVNVHDESLTAMNGSVASIFNTILLNYFRRWFFRVYGLLGENFRSTDLTLMIKLTRLLPQININEFKYCTRSR